MGTQLMVRHPDGPESQGRKLQALSHVETCGFPILLFCESEVEVQRTLFHLMPPAAI